MNDDPNGAGAETAATGAGAGAGVAAPTGAGAATAGATPGNAGAADGGQQTGAEARGTVPGGLLTTPNREGGKGTEGAPPEGGTTQDGEGEGDTPTVDPLDTVPEDGKYALNLPEGMEVDEALAAEAFPVFKAAGLTARQANALGEFFGTIRAKEAQQRNEAWVAVNQKWQAEAKSDPEYAAMGGFEAAAALANRAIEKFGTPAFDKALVENGWSNHPEMIRLLVRAGRALADDTSERGSGDGVDAAVSLEQSMYGATTPTTKRK